MAIIFFYVRDFFVLIGNSITLVFDLFVSLISALLDIIRFLGVIFLHLPLVFTATVTVIVVVSVLYKVLGREGGS